MKNTTLIFTVLLTQSIFTQSVFAVDTKQSAKDFMQDYLDSYEKYLEAGDKADVAWVTENFSEPLVMMPPTGAAPKATREEFAPTIKYFLEEALKKKGIVKLKWVKLQIASLSDTQALVSGLADAVDKNGKTVEQKASIYLLTKSKDGWTVTVNLPHSPDTVPTLKG